MTMNKWIVKCEPPRLEPESELYGEYADPRKRTFPNDGYGRGVEDYLIRRAREMQWDTEMPTYRIVPVDE
jgi:hypothetical protein